MEEVNGCAGVERCRVRLHGDGKDSEGVMSVDSALLIRWPHLRARLMRLRRRTDTGTHRTLALTGHWHSQDTGTYRTLALTGHWHSQDTGTHRTGVKLKILDAEIRYGKLTLGQKVSSTLHSLLGEGASATCAAAGAVNGVTASACERVKDGVARTAKINSCQPIVYLLRCNRREGK